MYHRARSIWRSAIMQIKKNSKNSVNKMSKKKLNDKKESAGPLESGEKHSS
jgi:hypothetical protein